MQSVFRYYEVSQPPTSGEVREAAYEVLQKELGRMCVELVSRQKVPSSETKIECFHVVETRHSEYDQSMDIQGRKESDDHSITIRTYADPQQPATARAIVATEE